MKANYSPAKYIIIFIVIFFVVGYIAFPLLHLVLESFSDRGNYSALLSKPVLKACTNSILLGIISVLGSGFIGVYFAYLFQYKKFHFKSFFSTAVLLPMAIPPMVGVISFLFLLGDNGLISKIISPLTIKFNGWPAIIGIHLYSFYPLFFLFTGPAFKSIDSSIVEASYSMGAGKFRTFLKIILPQLKASLIGASLLTFMASMASFSAPFIFGGNQRFLTTEIYYSKINGDNSFSAALSLLLTVISLIFMCFFRLYRKSQSGKLQMKGVAKTELNVIGKKYDFISLSIIILFCVIIASPIFALITLSFVPDNSLMQSSLNFTPGLFNFKRIFSEPDFFQPFANSLKISFVALCFIIIFGLMVTSILKGKRNIFKSLLELTISLSYGIPGTVIAICLILSFNSPNIFSFNSILVGTFWILPVAYVIRNLPIFTQSVISGLYSIAPSIEDASYTLGAGNLKTWRSIILPLLMSSILQGSMLVFINSFGEFVATILLYNYSTKTTSVEVYSQLRSSNNGMAAAYGALIFLVVLIFIYLSRKAINKSKISAK
jgi:iron(III) transport system permease protein